MNNITLQCGNCNEMFEVDQDKDKVTTQDGLECYECTHCGAHNARFEEMLKHAQMSAMELGEEEGLLEQLIAQLGGIDQMLLPVPEDDVDIVIGTFKVMQECDSLEDSALIDEMNDVIQVANFAQATFSPDVYFQMDAFTYRSKLSEHARKSLEGAYILHYTDYGLCQNLPS